ncbi:MAG: HNH endonuclease signature motif containing protein, partial [Terriglobales bacterium]
DAAAKGTYELLFGQVLDISTQSADVPRAGKPYSQEAFRMVLDMVNRLNGITPAMWQQVASRAKSKVEALPDETDGERALAYLRKVKAAAAFVSDNGTHDSGSLGMDMAVYAYSDSGKFNPAGFIAVHEFALQLKSKELLSRFTAIREKFEEFVVRHQSFIQQLGHIKGSRTRPLESAVAMYMRLFESIESGLHSDEQIIEYLRRDERLSGLQDVSAPENTTKRRRFSRSIQEAGVIRTTLQNRERCPICGARLPPACRSKDHGIPRETGGTGSLENLQFTHPYCNTGYKEQQRSKAAAAF